MTNRTIKQDTAPVIEWTIRRIERVWLDVRYMTYCVSVEMETSDDESSALETGADYILQDQQKTIEENTIEEVFYVDEVYQSSRNSKYLFLVCIDKETLDNLEDTDSEPEVLYSVSYDTVDLESKIDIAKKFLTESEGKNVEDAFGLVFGLYTSNSVQYKKDFGNSIELSFDENWKLTQVVAVIDGASNRLSKGLETASTTFPLNSVTTVQYMFGLDVISQFYIQQGDVDEAREQLGVSSTQSDSTLSEMLDLFSGEDISSLRGLADKELEDSFLANPELTESIYQERLEWAEFLGDPSLKSEEISSLMKKSNTLEGVFNNVLHKIDLKKLLMSIAECVGLQIDLPSQLPDFKMKIPPAMDWPDKLPIKDYMADLPKQILQMVLDILVQSFVSMVQELLQDIAAQCSFDSRFGEYDLNNWVVDENGILSIAEASSLSEEDLSKILSAISAVLSPTELCKLVAGDASDVTLRTVESVLSVDYPVFYQSFDGRGEIVEWFKSFSSVVQCDYEDSTGQNVLCKSAELTEEQLERRRERFEQLSSMLQGNLVNSDVGDVFGGLSSDGIKTSGMVSDVHPSVEYLLDKVFDTTFNGIKSTFNNDANDFPDAMLTNETTESVQDYAVEVDGRKIKNPALMGLGYENTVEEWEGEQVTLQTISRQPAFSLNSDLNRLLQSDQLYWQRSIDNSNLYILFDMEYNASERSIIDAALSGASGVNEMGFELPDAIQTLSDARENLGTWTYRYLVPVSDLAVDVSDDLRKVVDLPIQEVCVDEEQATSLQYNTGITKIDDDYQFDIEIRDDNVFSIQRENLLDPEKQEKVDSLPINPLNDKNYIPLQETFGSFIEKEWEDNVGDSGSIKDFFAGAVFSEQTKQLLQLMVNAVLGSVYFGEQTQTYMSGTPFERTSRIPNIALLNLIREPTTEQKACGLDPHILDFDSLKSDFKQDFDASLGYDEDYIDNILMESCLKLTIRVYLADYLLRGIFTVTSFQLEEALDDLLLSYLVEKIQEELAAFGETYRDSFLNYVNDIFGDEDSGLDDSLRALIEQEYEVISKRIVATVGNSLLGDSLKKYFVEDLPVFGVQTTTTERRFDDSHPLQDGGFVLEEYIKVVDYTGRTEDYIVSYLRDEVLSRDDNLKGTVNPEQLVDYVQNQLEYTLPDSILTEQVTLQAEKWADIFQEVKYGIRLNYIPPLSEDDFSTRPGVATEDTEQLRQIISEINRETKITSGNITGSFNFAEISSNISAVHPNKAYSIFEKKVEDIGHGDIEFIREVNPIPLVSYEVEISETISEFDLESTRENAKLSLIDTENFKLLFEYIFPLRRLWSVLVLYNIQGVSLISTIPIVFKSSKEEMARLFWTIQDETDYEYEDEAIQCVGGTSSLKRMTDNMPHLKMLLPPEECQAEVVFCPSLPEYEFDSNIALKYALKAPLMILKGLAEMVDPNISIASKLQQFGKSVGVCLPILPLSLGLLPSNIFMTTPGPPISPLGFIYHMMNIGNLSFGENVPETSVPCPDDEGEN